VDVYRVPEQRSTPPDVVAALTGSDDDIRHMLSGLSPAQIGELVDSLPPLAASALLDSLGGIESATLPASPIEQAYALGEPFRVRPQLEYLSSVIVDALHDVENGIDRKIIVQMPPRSGKTTMLTMLTPAWILALHPSWSVALVSHDPSLATSWGRQIRRWVEAGLLGPGVRVAPDAGAVSEWETTERGKLMAVSYRESLTGRGCRVLCIDDPIKDAVSAHSLIARDAVWDWWRSVAQTRLEPPSLVIVTLTRWHDDDIVGRLLSSEFDGDPADWTVVELPAVAEEGDQLGREVGAPLLSPIIDEDDESATKRLEDVRRNVGEYVWAALYQQKPSPAQGAIFSTDWWRFWTTDPARATEDGRVVYLDPDTLAGGRWLDSWDCAFKGLDSSDWVVGQRWVKVKANRFLIAQRRGRWSFTQTISEMKAWAHGGGPHGRFVHQRLIEDKANGPAILDVLHEEIPGLKPINPKTSKEARARSVTPECQSGNVYLPHPRDPGNAWVLQHLLPELRDFPSAKNDDQVDTLTQALTEFRERGSASLTVPGASSASPSPGAPGRPIRSRPSDPRINSPRGLRRVTTTGR